ncbi:MAG: YkgJ family cysteine cluster protein [Deltaproteobacteria bacterium]|nr:YkgJ family cysteine cluster protein [Deltaproteobacteria bacterium]
MAGFKCQRCAGCCYGRGGIWLNRAGRRQAAGHLGMTVGEFTDSCLTWESGLWSVGVGAAGRCLLLSGSRCLIQPVKPLMCRVWPFFDGPLHDEATFREARAACPGLALLDWADFKRSAPLKKPPRSFRIFLLGQRG